MLNPCREVRGCFPACAHAAGFISANSKWARGLRILFFLPFLFAGVPTLAKDVAREQSAVEYARQEFERAEAQHRADLEQAERTRKALESLKKQFAQEQNKARVSAQLKQQAKARLDNARQALDRAWKQ